MKITVRAFQADDIDRAIEMWKQTDGVLLDQSDSPDRIRAFLEANEGFSFVADDEQDAMVGSILCGHDTRRGYIYHLAVSHGSRRLGIGKVLVSRSLDALAANGIHKCHIHVLTTNDLAESFWIGVGRSRHNDILTLSAFTDG